MALPRYRQLLVLASLVFATALCAGLLVLRVAYSHETRYLHLLWNLFLAWLPVLSSFIAYNLYRRNLHISTPVVIGAAFIWLLFFPNAPYLLTDLIHLHPAGNVPQWYDLLMLVTFGWTGAFLGLVSLYMMQALIRRAFGPLSSWIFVLGALGAGSFGIYLGRFLRWNSWDLLTNPSRILRDILERLRHPIAHMQTFAFSMIFFLFLMATYGMVMAMVQLNDDVARSPADPGPRSPAQGSPRRRAPAAQHDESGSGEP
jgi:uncharacterized membrane protein